MLTFPCTYFAHRQVATSLSALTELLHPRGLDLNKYDASAASAAYQCVVSLPERPMRQAVHRLLPISSTPHCDRHTTECVWPPPAISVWSHNEGHGDCIALIIHTQRQARLEHVKQYRQYESRIKHLGVLRRRHDVYACVTAHRCACTQKVNHSPHGTAVNPLGVFFFFFFNPLTVNFTAEERRQLCLLSTKHIGKWTRSMLSETSSEAP